MKKDQQKNNQKEKSDFDEICEKIRKKLESIGIPKSYIGPIVLAIAAVLITIWPRDRTPKIRHCFKESSKRQCAFSNEIDRALRKEKCVFVSIPYTSTAESNYRNCVCEVLRELEYTPKLAKDELMTGNFTCKICRLIQKSQFIVADISGANPNVLHELGIAQGISRRVFIIRDSRDPVKVPSNIQQLEYLPYDLDERIFKDRLSQMIEETLAGD